MVRAEDPQGLPANVAGCWPGQVGQSILHCQTRRDQQDGRYVSKEQVRGSWKEYKVAGYGVFSQFLMGYLMDYGCFCP